MASGLDMSLDDMISKNRKSRRGSGPGPARRIPNRIPNRSAPYPSAKAPETSWKHDMFPDRAAIETGTKLYVSNLDYGVSNEDLKELFAEAGDLKRYTVHYDRSGRSKGTAEVVYSRRVDALAAVKKYNNVQLDGKPMKIEIVGTNLPTAATLAKPVNASSGRRGQGRGGQRQRGRGGRRGGKATAEKISAEDLDADLDKYHAESMQTDS